MCARLNSYLISVHLISCSNLVAFSVFLSLIYATRTSAASEIAVLECSYIEIKKVFFVLLWCMFSLTENQKFLLLWEQLLSLKGTWTEANRRKYQKIFILHICYKFCSPMKICKTISYLHVSARREHLRTGIQNDYNSKTKD